MTYVAFITTFGIMSFIYNIITVSANHDLGEAIFIAVTVTFLHIMFLSFVWFVTGLLFVIY